MTNKIAKTKHQKHTCEWSDRPGGVKKICFFFTTYGPKFSRGVYPPLTPLPPVHTYDQKSSPRKMHVTLQIGFLSLAGLLTAYSPF